MKQVFSSTLRVAKASRWAALSLTTLLSSTLLASPGHADEVKWSPILDARIRYENVDQTGFTKDADALTARLRAGLQASFNDFIFLAEGEGTLPIVEHYNSTTNGKASYPVVADPENAELNRLQVQYTGITDTTVTVGRQRINIGDQRFVGSVGWRQNEQTFDAVRVESQALGPVTADVTYSWSDRTIFGYNSSNKSVHGDNFFVTLGGKLGSVKLDGFAFLIDQNEPARLQFSSQTYGLRAATDLALAEDTKFALTASYARQSDWKDNPNNYKADYWLADATLRFGKATIDANYEVLGADNGAAFTSFQTPLATLHKFQGWADKFLTTPANGIRDVNGGGSYALGKIGFLGPVKLAGTYHDFRSDIGSAKYGHEWDALVLTKPRPDLKFIVKFADYKADTFATDTQKIWVEFDYSL